MSISAATVQNVNGGGASIVANDPPPEGRAGTTITFQWEEGGPVTLQSYLQMNSPQGLPLSQVVSLVIDNTRNPSAINVIHGAFAEVVTIPAYGYQIVPTFSNKAPYFISLTLAPGSSPATADIAQVLFLNYARQSASFGGNGIANNSPASSAGIAWSSGFQALTSPGQSLAGLGPVPFSLVDDYSLYELDIDLGVLVSTAPGVCIAYIQIAWFTNTGPTHTWDIMATAVATAAGQGLPLARHVTWAYNPTPLYLPPNKNVNGGFVASFPQLNVNTNAVSFVLNGATQKISANPAPSNIG